MVLAKRGVRSERGLCPLSLFLPLSFTLPRKERGTKGVRFKNHRYSHFLKTYRLNQGITAQVRIATSNTVVRILSR